MVSCRVKAWFSKNLFVEFPPPLVAAHAGRYLPAFSRLF